MPASRSVARIKPGKSTLGRLFGSEARAKILTALLLGSQERYYVRDLAKRLALPPTAVSRELLTLERLGLVHRQTEGRRLYCELNRGASALAELPILMLKLRGVAASGARDPSFRGPVGLSIRLDGERPRYGVQRHRPVRGRGDHLHGAGRAAAADRPAPGTRGEPVPPHARRVSREAEDRPRFRFPSPRGPKTRPDRRCTKR